LVVASSLLLFTDAVRTRLLPWLVSYAVGALLGVALLALLPEALTLMAPAPVFGTLLAGILVFFILEKLVLLRHCHADECQVHASTAPLVIIGDAFQISSTERSSARPCFLSAARDQHGALAVARTRFPGGGDFAILLAAGTAGRALLLNVASGAGIVGALVAYSAVEVIPGIDPACWRSRQPASVYRDVRGFRPAPRRGRSNAVRQVVLIAAGIATVVGFESCPANDGDARNLATVETMWRREVEAAHTYRLSPNANPTRSAATSWSGWRTEDRHADRWSDRITAATGRRPDRAPVERGLSWFQRIGDPNVVLHRLEQEETKAEAEYDDLLSRLTDPLDRKIAEEAMLDERDHAVILRTLAGGKIPTP
jgi:zinc and cadmium transporter